MVKVDLESAGRESSSTDIGDMLVLDPGDAAGDAGDVTQSKNFHYLSKLLNLDGRFFEVKVTPAGDTLTLTPLAAPLGKVATSFDQCRAVLSGERGVVSICAEKDRPALLPAGQWRLLAYTIQQTAAVLPRAAHPGGFRQSVQAGAEDGGREGAAGEKSFLEALVRALGFDADDEDDGPEGSSLSGNRMSSVSAGRKQAWPRAESRPGCHGRAAHRSALQTGRPGSIPQGQEPGQAGIDLGGDGRRGVHGYEHSWPSSRPAAAHH